MPQTIPLALAVAEKAFREFYNQWLCGLQPFLSLETAADGQICVLFKVVAGDATGQQESACHRGGVDEQAHCQAAKAQQYHRRRSPSYRRRLLRRAAAREAADGTVKKRTEAEMFVQTDTENLSRNTPPHPDPVLPCMLAVEAEQQPQHDPQYLPRDEVCSDETYAESFPHLGPATLPQLDGHDDSHVLNHTEINVMNFLDIIKNQEDERRRDAENAREEREADLENFRKLINQSLL